MDIAIYAYLQSNNKKQDKLLKISKVLEIDFENINLDKYKKHLFKNKYFFPFTFYNIFMHIECVVGIGIL